MPADVRPYKINGTVIVLDATPHALRHSVAWRVMNAEEGHTLYDIRTRLRHRLIQTTERIHDHINEV